MLFQIIEENGVKKIQALTADTGTGAPVGSYLYLEKKSNPQGYLFCDGSTFDKTKYPLLYAYLGSNVLPDWREFSAVGAEQNTTNVYDAQTNPNGVIHDHDVYTEGQAKDDQLQDFRSASKWRSFAPQSIEGWEFLVKSSTGTNVTGRFGTTTHGKRKAVYIYIKATSGLSENAQDNVINTLNEQRSYSTEEHLTGKKWIDGKPTYEKVVEFSQEISLPLDTWVDTPQSNSNIARIINCKGFNNLGACFQVSGARDQGNYIRLLSERPSNTSLIGFMFEYTKTTD